MQNPMIAALEQAREAQGKTTEFYHISNEYRMLASILLRKDALKWMKENELTGDVKDHLDDVQLQALEALEAKNTALITAGIDFDERKRLLTTRAVTVTELAIVEIDALLKLVEAFRMTPQEIVKLNKSGASPADQEGYYNAALQVLQWRTDTNPNAVRQIDELAELAGYDGIILEPEAPEIPVVNIPIFAMGLL